MSTITTLSTQPPLVVENGMIYGGSGKVFTLVIMTPEGLRSGEVFLLSVLY